MRIALRSHGCACVCATFVPVLSARVMRMRNRAHLIHSVVGNSTEDLYTKHLLHLGRAPSPPGRCVPLLKAYLCFPYQVDFLQTN